MIEALGIGTVILALVAITAVALAWSHAVDAEKAAGEAEIANARTEAKLAIATATNATLTEALAGEKRRGDALDDALAATWTDDELPATARNRLLARWKVSRAAPVSAIATAGGGAVAVQPEAPSAGPVAALAGAGTGLLKPGD